MGTLGANRIAGSGTAWKQAFLTASLMIVVSAQMLAIESTSAKLPGSAAEAGKARFVTVDLAGVANAESAALLAAAGLPDWFATNSIGTSQIPFNRIPVVKNVVATLAGAMSPAVVPVRGMANEALLLIGALLPSDYQSVFGPARPIAKFSDPERFVIRVRYEDGLEDLMFPVCLESGKYEVVSGVGIYGLLNLRPVGLESIALDCRMPGARILLAGLTLNEGDPIVPQPFIATLPPPVAQRAIPARAASVVVGKDSIVLNTRTLTARFQTNNGLTLTSIQNHCLAGGQVQMGNSSFFEVGVGDRTLTSDRLMVTAVRATQNRVEIAVDANPQLPLAGKLLLTAMEDGEILMDLKLKNTSAAAITPVVNFPVFSQVVLGDITNTWHCFARQGGLISNLPTYERRLYSGRDYPLQVTGLFNPNLGGGMYLLVRDLTNISKYYVTDKTPAGVNWRIEYYPREYQAGESIETAETALAGNTGDWRAQLAAYQRWVATWYRPLAPRKNWFRDIYNYRQHYIWRDAWMKSQAILYDSETQTYQMDQVVAADRNFFGYCDYLHIFDFGRSKVYGRVGDYSHYDEIGGLKKLQSAIAGVQKDGTRVGLYLEGYLCDERGIWGRGHVQDGHILKKNGDSLWFGGVKSSTEHMMCPAREEWQNYLAGVYSRVARELQPSGMYIDQIGFGQEHKNCWSRSHGHPVPWSPVRGEFQLVRKIRQAVPPEIATLTEEVPTDVTTQLQDGALSYSSARPFEADGRTAGRNEAELDPHRVDLIRFVIPDFKIIQLTAERPYQQGNWGKLKFPFFNAECWWLNNPTSDGIGPAARDLLRTGLRVLHEHSDAFRSDHPEPLVPTCHPLIYANAFPGKSETAWTLLNAGYRTHRGSVLTVAHVKGATYRDAWNDAVLTPLVEGDRATLSVTLGPRDVGCVIQQRPR